jgi:bacteriocin-like protein
MAKATKQPRAAKKRGPKKALADQLAKTGKGVSVELSEDEMAKVSGGTKLAVSI